MRDDVLLARAAEQREPQLERSHGAAEMRFAPAGAKGETRVARLHQETPCRVLFPHAEPGDPRLAVLLTTSGGLTGGDSVRLRIEAMAGARALVTTQAAEKLYRALAGDCAIDVALTVGADAWLEWLPQETILFEGARLMRKTGIAVAQGGRLLAGDMLVFGRTAHGERFTRGRLHDAWRVRQGGRLVWADALHLEGDIARQLDHPAGFDQAVAYATALYVAPDAPAWLGTARRLLEDAASRAGATVVNGILLARFLGRDAQTLRDDLMRFYAGMRAAVAGLPRHMPRVWTT